MYVHAQQLWKDSFKRTFTQFLTLLQLPSYLGAATQFIRKTQTIFGEDQGDQMSLLKRCSPTHFFVKISTLNLPWKIVARPVGLGNSVIFDNLPKVPIHGWISCT
jgi:hypothetical protein